MRLAIIGSTSFKDKGRLYHEVNELRKQYEIDLIVSGGAPGADTYGEEYADEFGIDKLIFKADWTDMSEPCVRKINKAGREYNALAGFKRNTTIIDNCDIVLALWVNNSPGTKDSLLKAHKLGKILVVIRLKN